MRTIGERVDGIWGSGTWLWLDFFDSGVLVEDWEGGLYIRVTFAEFDLLYLAARGEYFNRVINQLMVAINRGTFSILTLLGFPYFEEELQGSSFCNNGSFVSSFQASQHTLNLPSVSWNSMKWNSRTFRMMKLEPSINWKYQSSHSYTPPPPHPFSAPLDSSRSSPSQSTKQFAARWNFVLGYSTRGIS